MTTIKQEIPKWFNGTIYEQGEEVQNRFSGESIELTAEELSMYDFVMGATMMMETSGFGGAKLAGDLRKGLNWFRKNNPEAYMVLLD